VPDDADLAARVDQLLGVTFVLSARLAEVEASNREMRALLCLDPPQPTIGADWRTIKQTAGETGFSQSTVRAWVARGEVSARKLGARVLIDASTIARRRSAK
jgi:hypothetical protein